MEPINKIPEFLKERRSRRVLITVWFGLIPLIMGSVGIYNYFTKKEEIYKGSNFKVLIEKSCGKEIILENCLYIVIQKDTFKTNLNNKLLRVYKDSYKIESKNEIELVYVENIIKKLKINDQIIVKYKSAFWWGIIFTLIGIIWVGGHIWFFIKDPYKKYTGIKDPFSKYKR